MHYYKFENGSTGCLKTPYEELPEGCEEITEEEYQQLLEASQPITPVRNSKADRIKALKKQLADSDYQAIKYAEGWISEEDYAPIKAHRQELRDEINQLEAELEEESNA